MKGSAAYQFQRAARSFRSVEAAKGGTAAETSGKRAEGVRRTFCQGRKGKRAAGRHGIRASGIGAGSKRAAGRRGIRASGIGAGSKRAAGRRGIRASGIRVESKRAAGRRGIRASGIRVRGIRAFIPAADTKRSPARYGSAHSIRKLGIRATKGRYFLVSPTGDLAPAVRGRYTLDDGSVLRI